MKDQTATHQHFWRYSDLGHHWCDDDSQDPCNAPEEARYHDWPCDHPEQHRPNDHN